MPVRRKLWIAISLILPIAFVVITLTRPAGPPGVVMEETAMPELPPDAPVDAGAGEAGASTADADR